MTDREPRKLLDDEAETLRRSAEALEARVAHLEAEIASTESWWMAQIHKHRPDLAEKLSREMRELRELMVDRERVARFFRADRH